MDGVSSKGEIKDSGKNMTLSSADKEAFVSQSLMPGVLLKSLKEIPTEGGPVLHMVRVDDPDFISFGEMYFSVVEQGAVKAWKRHKKQTQLFAVPFGLMKIVLYDDRPDSPSCGSINSFILGRPAHYGLLKIPPLVWYGFSALGNDVAILANCADIPHDPKESERLSVNSPHIPFSWHMEGE